jgi:hypothetical protein
VSRLAGIPRLDRTGAGKSSPRLKCLGALDFVDEVENTLITSSEYFKEITES